MAITTTIAGRKPPGDAVRQTRRAERHIARSALWKINADQPGRKHRVYSCGRHVTDSEQGVTLRLTTQADGSKRAGFSGYQSCGSVWACPVCAQRVQAERSTEVAEGLAAWFAAGGSVEFLTLTVRHERKHGLNAVWDEVGAAWTAMVGHRRWKELVSDLGVQGRLRATEVTYGDNGWHVHLHVLLFRRPTGRPIVRSAVSEEIWQLWSNAVTRRDMRPSRRHGVDLRAVQGSDALARYFTKQTYGSESVALEVANSVGKRASMGNRTPFQVLRDVIGSDVAEGRDPAADLDAWLDYQRGSKGRRQLVWSRGFRQVLGLGAERTDEEIAADDLGGDVLATMDAATATSAANRGVCWRLLDAAESGDLPALASVMHAVYAAVRYGPLDP